MARREIKKKKKSRIVRDAKNLPYVRRIRYVLSTYNSGPTRGTKYGRAVLDICSLVTEIWNIVIGRCMQFNLFPI